ncbi:MAG: multicopper oxidase domain-containing protein, partial [Pseudomonadales bacterium]|nr:multicopper oxidase domain-containing protein [Pseudomonadales bacterium]
KNPGTHFYHCHVQPDVHIAMGLAGMLIIEPNRPNNLFSHLVIGAGRIQDLSKATKEQYEREYSLVYTDIDDRLNRIPAVFTDPREIEKRMHRDYDSSKREPNIFMLNGRSFPFTLGDTPIEVKAGERTKLRILNAGERSLQLHIHGHHPTLTHVDGYEVPINMQLTRDVFTIGAAQRIDLELRPGSDERFASGPGVWFMHDHTEKTTTNKGISPGGDITVLVYEGFMDEEQGLPRVVTSLSRYFDPEFYRGNVPVFDPAIFHTTIADYAYGWDEIEQDSNTMSYPVRNNLPPLVPDSPLDSHQIIAKSCDKPRSFRRIVLKGGAKQGREGEVFGFEPSRLQVGRCEEIEIVFNNTDEVRHALMIPGLNPMFVMEFTGQGTQTARFITPDKDINLEFHCHVETHESMGMHGILVVGKGGKFTPDISIATVNQYQGVGIIIAVDSRKRRIVLDHEEIKDFMAAMVMGYQVASIQLLRGLEPGTKVLFTVNTDKREIVEMEPLSD